MSDKEFKSDIEIAREAKLSPIETVAKKIGIPNEAILNYGKNIAKIDSDFIQTLKDKKDV